MEPRDYQVKLINAIMREKKRVMVLPAFFGLSNAQLDKPLTKVEQSLIVNPLKEKKP